MRRALYYLVGIGVVFYGWQHYRQSLLAATDEPAAAAEAGTIPAEPAPQVESGHRCDGRVYCSQMRSCDEATWFLEHCPRTKMDGDGDGVPCESQWCGHQ